MPTDDGGSANPEFTPAELQELLSTPELGAIAQGPPEHVVPIEIHLQDGSVFIAECEAPTKGWSYMSAGIFVSDGHWEDDLTAESPQDMLLPWTNIAYVRYRFDLVKADEPAPQSDVILP